MSSLQIRDVPADLLEKLRAISAKERRSVNAQALVMLAEAVRDKQARLTIAELIEKAGEIRRAANGRGKIPDSAQLIRKARAGRGR